MTLPDHTKFNKHIVLLILILLGCFVIFFRFNSVPSTTTFDEIEFAKLALSLFNVPYTPYSSFATGHATLYFYILLFSLKIFGISTFALRLPSALFGLASVIIFYFVLKKSIQKSTFSHSPFLQLILPIIGTFLFITTRWYFNFARFGFEATFLLFLELTSILFLLYFFERKHHLWILLSGVFAGLAYNSYQPGRIFVIVPLIMIGFSILSEKTKRSDFAFFTRHAVHTLLRFIIPFLIIITPLTVYLSQHSDVRISQLAYPTNNELSFEKKVQFFGSNLASTALMFSVKGDVNGRHNYPHKAALNPLISVLLLIGISAATLSLGNSMNTLYLSYFFLALFPTLFTYPWENPNMLRTITCLPAVIFFVTQAIGHIIYHLAHTFRWKQNALLIVVFLFLILSAGYELRTYFVFQATVFQEAFEAQMPLSYYIDHPDVKGNKE